MKLYEYQGADLFRAYGIPVPSGIAVCTPEEALEVATRLGFPVVLKAQVHTGGRGKAGGVRVVNTADEVRAAASQILGLEIKGLPVRKLLVAEVVRAAREVYLSLVVDRRRRKASFIACAEGGVEIETTAKESPEKILRLDVAARELKDVPLECVMPIAASLFPHPRETAETANLMHQMARLFAEKDCSLVEINPLVCDESGKVIALDSKVILDDNALFRHPELMDLRDPDAEDADEIAAKEEGLSFIRLDGNIGCMVNGAGLAMATMDIIKYYGGKPANFLDVGGSSDPKKVIAAFRLILKDPHVKVILVNIFGGITRCDDIARGIIESLRQFEVRVPLIVRLVGTNEAEGRRLLKEAEVISAATLDEAAARAAEIVGALR